MRKPDLSKLVLLFSRFRRKIIIGVSVVVAALFLCGLTGYLFLPGYLKSKMEQAVAEKLHRQLRIQDISFNPFLLSVTLKGVTLTERDSEKTFVSFDRLYVNLSSLSVFTLSPVIQAVSLENPYLHLSRTQSNQYNISDLIEMAMQPDEPDKKPLSYSIDDVEIDGGKIVFDDLPMRTRHQVEELRIRIPFLSSSPSQTGTFIEPHLSALVNGTKVELSGKTRPFAEDRETVFNLAFGNIDLPRYMEYLPYKPDFRLASGKLSFDLNLHYAKPANKSSDLSISGTAALNSLLVTDLGKRPMIGLNKLVVSLDKNAIFANDYRIAKVELSQPEIHVVNRSDGHLNLMKLAPRLEKGEGKTAPHGAAKKENQGALKLLLKTFAVHGGKLRYTDYATDMPYTMVAERFNLTVDDVAVNTGEKTARIGKIASDSANLEMTMERKRPGRHTSKEAVSGSSGFAVNIGHVDIGGWSGHVRNNNLKKPLGTNITGLTANIQNISTEPGKVSALKVLANVDKKGRIALEGKMGISPLLADIAIDLKDVSIVAVQRYIDEYVNLTLRQADVSAKGHLSLSSGREGALRGEFKGDLTVANLSTTDQVSGDPFVRWKDLSFKQIHAMLSPFSLTIAQAELNSFFTRLILSSDGRLNLQNILRSKAGGQKSLTDSEEYHGAQPQEGAQAPPPDGTQASPPEGTQAKPEQVAQEKADDKPKVDVASGQTDAKAAASAPESADTPAARSLPPIRIDRFQLKDGRMRFTDNFIKPSYTANMSRVRGAITGISSANNAIAVVDVKGEVNRAPLTIAGTINPFDPTSSLELQGNVKGMELAQFSSYSAKYVGYGIEKGKLSFDVRYKVENGELHAQNRLILDQLTFSEQSEGTPVINLPVRFAVNLLKDANGVIDVDLPVSGTLSDPEFSVGSIVFKVIVNLIKKVVTAPFSLLAAAFSGGEELSWLDFTPGQSDITAKGGERLVALAKALKSRPALKLDITGRYDAEQDKAGLARPVIDRKVRELKRKEMGEEGENTPLSRITVSDEEYARLLKKVYGSADFKKPRNFIGLQKSLPVAEMESLMIRNYVVTEKELKDLADRRAANVKAWLLEKGGIAEERLFILASKSLTGESSTRADFTLH